jgi:hypothetical protein
MIADGIHPRGKLRGIEPSRINGGQQEVMSPAEPFSFFFPLYLYLSSGTAGRKIKRKEERERVCITSDCTHKREAPGIFMDIQAHISITNFLMRLSPFSGCHGYLPALWSPARSSRAAHA